MDGISSTFLINETVGFLHEIGTAVVLRVDGNWVEVEDENGFERRLRSDLLVKLYVRQIDIEKHEVEEKKSTIPKEKLTPLPKGKNDAIPEIDLHIEELTESNGGMTNGEIVTVQLRALEHFFQEMIRLRIRKFIVIHGVGEGKLKSEVRSFIKSRKGAYAYDADFRRYGIGATEVEIRFTEIAK